MSDPIFPFDVWTQQITQASVPANRNALRSQILQSTLVSLTESTQPAAPEDGDVYSLPAGATGSAWDAFEENDLAIYRDGAWYAFAPVLGLVVAGPDGDVVFTEAGWAPYSSSGGATVFTQLGDVPSSYTGQEGRLVAVNATGDGLVFVESVPGGAEAFTDLTDTPADYTGQEGKLVAVNDTGDGLEFVDAPEPGGASEFIQLTDTPSSYTGQAGRVPVVNDTEDGLEFEDLPEPPEVPESFTELNDTPASYSGQGGKVVAVKSDESGLEFIPAPEGSGFNRAFDDLDTFPGQLFFSLRGGMVRSPTGAVFSFPSQSISLPDDSVVYVEAEVNEFGDVIIWSDTTGWNPQRAPLWLLETSGGQIVSRVDMRPTFTFQPEGGAGSESFTQLTDTPADYTGQAGRVPVVNGTEDGLVFEDLPEPGGASDFLELLDTPDDYTGSAGMVVVVNAEEDGLDFVELPAPGGATAFTDLTDTPADYTGQAGRKVVVNSAEDGLEFVPDGSGSDVDWVKISTDFTGSTEATAGAAESMAVGPGAQTLPGSAASQTPISSQNYGDGTGYLFFPSGPLPFSPGSTVILSGFPSGGLATYGNYGLDSWEDPTTVILDASSRFSVGTVLTVANAANPAIEGDFPIVAMNGPQILTLGGGFSATDADLDGATFTGLEPDVNGEYEVLEVYYQQLILAGFDYTSSSLPPEALVSSLVEGKSVAIGPEAVASADRSVALGYGTTNNRSGSVSIGGRVLTGLLQPSQDDDAVTVAYMRNNQPTVEQTLSAGGTIDSTPGERNFSQMMYQSNDTAAFYDGKLVAFDPATGAVSSWTLSFNVWVDTLGQMVVSSYTLDPVAVDPAHSGLEFEAVVDTSSSNYWKLTYVNAAGPVKFSATIRRTVAYNF